MRVLLFIASRRNATGKVPRSRLWEGPTRAHPLSAGKSNLLCVKNWFSNISVLKIMVNNEADVSSPWEYDCFECGRFTACAYLFLQILAVPATAPAWLADTKKNYTTFFYNKSWQSYSLLHQPIQLPPCENPVKIGAAVWKIRRNRRTDWQKSKKKMVFVTNTVHK